MDRSQVVAAAVAVLLTVAAVLGVSAWPDRSGTTTAVPLERDVSPAPPPVRESVAPLVSEEQVQPDGGLVGIEVEVGAEAEPAEAVPPRPPDGTAVKVRPPAPEPETPPERPPIKSKVPRIVTDIDERRPEVPRVVTDIDERLPPGRR